MSNPTARLELSLRFASVYNFGESVLHERTAPTAASPRSPVNLPTAFPWRRDERSLLFSQKEDHGSDLMVVENFR